MLYGPGNCERINKFTYNENCPLGYHRDDHSRCKRVCSIVDQETFKQTQDQEKIINFKCWNQKVQYINNFDSRKSLEHCLEDFEYCREKKLQKDNEFVTLYVQDCPPNKFKLGFMCIPMCMSEMSEDVLKNIANDPNYCVEDYVELGLPIYDFN